MQRLLRKLPPRPIRPATAAECLSTSFRRTSSSSGGARSKQYDRPVLWIVHCEPIRERVRLLRSCQGGEVFELDDIESLIACLARDQSMPAFALSSAII
jgi:hypothetical protein